MIEKIIIIDIAKNWTRDENFVIKQTQLDEIKWFVYLLKLIW
jgi:hypothetical protein